MSATSLSRSATSAEGGRVARRAPTPDLDGADDGAREPLLVRLRKVNLARLNHVFIPSKKQDRDRLRTGPLAKVLGPLFGLAGSLTREGRSFAVICLLMAAASVDVGESQVYLLFATLVGLFVAALVTRPFFGMASCRLVVESAARVSVGEPMTFLLTITNEGPRDVWSVRIERPFLPWDGKWIGAQPSVRRVAAGGRATTRAEATFVERGEHHLDAFDAARVVPLGLTLGRRVESAGARFLVVPVVADVPRVTLSYRSPIRDGRSVASSTPGDGEIAGVRPYRLGDPLKHLHVRTWARTGTPHVRHYVDERADRVALVLSFDGTDAPEPRVEAAISLAAGILARLASGDGSGVDHLVLDQRAVRIVPRRGRAALDLGLDALAKLSVDGRAATTHGHVEELLPSLSTVVLVTTDHHPRRQKLVELVERGGVPCRWIEVVDDGAAGIAPRTVEMGAITRREAVPC